jgi:hypothetical protein
MKCKAILAALAACALTTLAAQPVVSELLASKAYADGAAKPRVKGRSAARVKGFVQRGGYYSYVDEDAINTSAWARSLFTSTSPFRTPFTERQTSAGPFDSGFFFDSGLGPAFNDSPYPR